MKHLTQPMLIAYLIFSGSLCIAKESAVSAEKTNQPPAGFISLFNGKDFSGWHGLGHADPRKIKNLSPADRTKRQTADNKNLNKHWKVAEGLIVNDGRGVYLTTDKEYGDFELRVDWKMLKPHGDSGIYVRGCPQIQIWDPKHKAKFKHGCDKGSGGLWNNNGKNNGRFPLVLADNPIGQWNTLRITLRGDVATVYLNDKLVVDKAVMQNYFDRKQKLFERGVIQLQTHGSEMHFRNVFLKTFPTK